MASPMLKGQNDTRGKTMTLIHLILVYTGMGPSVMYREHGLIMEKEVLEFD